MLFSRIKSNLKRQQCREQQQQHHQQQQQQQQNLQHYQQPKQQQQHQQKDGFEAITFDTFFEQNFSKSNKFDFPHSLSLSLSLKLSISFLYFNMRQQRLPFKAVSSKLDVHRFGRMKDAEFLFLLKSSAIRVPIYTPKGLMVKIRNCLWFDSQFRQNKLPKMIHLGTKHS